MTMLKKIGFASFAALSVAEQAFAQGNAGSAFGLNNSTSNVGNTASGQADSVVMNIIRNAMIFITFIAVCYGLWGGFKILTAGGDDGAVKEGRTILIQVGIGIIVMWLSYSVVNLVISALLK